MDSGAVSNNLQEKDLTLEVSKYIYNRLQELGIPSVITREQDEYLPKNARIQRIKELVGNNPNTLLISNHINAGGGEGAEVVYSLRNRKDFAEEILNHIGEKGQIKRKIYQRRLPENPNLDYYYILRETPVEEPVLIEYGFIDNPKDSIKLKNNLLEYGEGVVEAIADYLGYPYEEELKEEYIVKKGDTLYSISKKYNIPVDEIIRINNLKSNLLQIGQVIYLNNMTPTTEYIVKKGDTLYSISRKTNTSIEDIIETNNLTSDILSIGQILIIPTNKEDNGEGIYDFPEDEIKDFIQYEVKKGDSLWLISQKFDITVPELIDINNLENLTIYAGQKLLVPNPSNISEFYTVEKGDTIWSIAKKFNLTVDELKEINNLDTNMLSVGQQLIIQ